MIDIKKTFSERYRADKVTLTLLSLAFSLFLYSWFSLGNIIEIRTDVEAYDKVLSVLESKKINKIEKDKIKFKKISKKMNNLSLFAKDEDSLFYIDNFISDVFNKNRVLKPIINLSLKSNTTLSIPLDFTTQNFQDGFNIYKAFDNQGWLTGGSYKYSEDIGIHVFQISLKIDLK